MTSMDAAYDSIEIWAHSIALGHKPIIDVNPRRSADMQEALKREKRGRRTLGLVFPEERRHVVRTRPSGEARPKCDEISGPTTAPTPIRPRSPTQSR